MFRKIGKARIEIEVRKVSFYTNVTSHFLFLDFRKEFGENIKYVT